MAIKHVFNWAAWLATIRAKAFKAGAEGFIAAISAWSGTNGLSTIPIDALKNVGMTWEQAVAMLLASVVVRMLFAVAKFVQEHPEPDILEERSTSDALKPPGSPPPNT